MLNINSKIKVLLIFILFALTTGLSATEPPWYYFVRTSGHPLNAQNIDSIIKDAQQTHLFGIEVDNDITGRYDSFLNPEQKLDELRQLAQKAHAINNYAFVYIAGLECITPNADQRQHTFFKDHPDWVQRDINGRPAIFSSKDAFWIHEGDEDVWISPFAQPWRQLYMERVRQIAATGIDGIYVDIPYWMTHFEGWENTWASFDVYTVQAFKQKTGLDAKKDLQLGDFNDPNFRQWIDFRLEAIRDFMAEIDRNVKQVNPNCLTIAEIYPGIDFESIRVGADVAILYPVVDVIAHEYSEGAYMASDRQPFDWYRYLIGMLTFRSLANGKPSWMLSYSWDGNQNVEPADAMKLLFLSQLFAGTNSWDAATHVMSGSNDYATRTRVFKWIAQFQNHFYGPVQAIRPIGIYFSDKTRNYYASDFIPSFVGFVLMAMQTHKEFQIVNRYSLKQFKGPLLILPEVKILTSSEMAALKELQNKGVFLIFTKSSSDDSTSKEQLSILNQEKLAVLQPCPGKQYFELNLDKFNEIVQNVNSDSSLLSFAKHTMDDIASHGKWQPVVQLMAPVSVVFKAQRLNGKIHLTLMNFSGIKGGQKVKPTPIKNLLIDIKNDLLTSTKLTLLPYLGQPEILTGTQHGKFLRFEIKNLNDGAFLWEN